MKLYRVMSEGEFDRLMNLGVQALRKDHRGRVVKGKWFATDPRYIETIISRHMYRNRKVKDAYKYMVIFNVPDEIFEKIVAREKVELGFRNVFVPSRYLFNEFIKIKGYVSIDDIEDKVTASPILYYWGKRGMLRVFGSSEFRNILINGNFKKRVWFVRADKFWLIEKVLE